MRRRRSAVLFSFSFLDVFACTLGALIFILVGCVLEGQRVTRLAEDAMAKDNSRTSLEIEELHEEQDRWEGEQGWRRDAVRQSLDHRREALAKARKALADAEAREAQLASRKEDLEWTWGRLPTEVTGRVPVYLECKDGHVRIQPGGVPEAPQELAAPGSRTRALLTSLRGDRRRYPVLILRSTGFEVYQAVEQLCDSLGVDFAREPLLDDTRIVGWK